MCVCVCVFIFIFMTFHNLGEHSETTTNTYKHVRYADVSNDAPQGFVDLAWHVPGSQEATPNSS